MSHRGERFVALIGLILISSCDSKSDLSPDFLTEQEMKAVDPWLLPPDMVEKLTAQAGEADGFSAWMLHLYYEHQHDSKAHKYLVQAAELGVSPAQCTYYTFLVQSPDRETRERAVIWLEKAARQGYQPAVEGLQFHETQLRLAEKRDRIVP